MDKSYYFYVLYCQDDSLYAGYTRDLQRRLQVHNQGKGAKYTRVNSRRPVSMIYAEEFSSRSAAMSAEAKFKQLSRAQKETYLLNHGLSVIQEGPVFIYKGEEDGHEDSE